MDLFLNLYKELEYHTKSIAVIGLGYVGLPIATALSSKTKVIGFDTNKEKIESYRKGIDLTGDLEKDALKNSEIFFTSDPEALADASFFIVAVPTPIKSSNIPDLTYVKKASELVAKYMGKGAIVVYESTVYPGVTEEVCLPVLEQVSGLVCGVDFKIGYSPERINPGDKVHKLHNIVKIVSGMDDQALEIIAKVYELVVEAGVFRASSIRVAEAAKVIENAQRDINIAFMNELSMLFNKMDIPTKDVLDAAGTKWNFLPFSPGLVGGHCIGIDPYYLTYKAEDTGYHSKIILAGRHINDGMGAYVAQQIVKRMNKLGIDSQSSRVALIGFTYKEDSSDIRNTKVVDIIDELKEFGIRPIIYDPIADVEEANKHYKIQLASKEELVNLDVVIVAVPHQQFSEMQCNDFNEMFQKNSVKLFVDVKNYYDRSSFIEAGFQYWSL